MDDENLFTGHAEYIHLTMSHQLLVTGKKVSKRLTFLTCCTGICSTLPWDDVTPIIVTNAHWVNQGASFGNCVVVAVFASHCKSPPPEALCLLMPTSFSWSQHQF